MSVDEEAIKKLVLDRAVTVDVSAVWFTPAGRRRSTPSYEATIQNDYLGESRTIKAKALPELQTRCREQFEKWAEKEIKGRIRDAREHEIATAKAAAASASSQAQARVDAVRGILRAALAAQPQIAWESLYESTAMSQFTAPAPAAPKFEDAPQPRPTIVERLIPPLLKWRELERRNARAAYEEFRAERLGEWHARHAEWTRNAGEHQAREAASLAERRRNNRELDKFRLDLARGQKDAVARYLEIVFDRCGYPDAFPVQRAVDYRPDERAVTIALTLPTLENLSKVKDVRFVKGESAAAMLSDSDHARLYESAVFQAALRTAYEVFGALDRTLLTWANINGWVHNTDPATGKDGSRCIIALRVHRERFEGINLERVDAEPCLRSLGVSVADRLCLMRPTQPCA